MEEKDKELIIRIIRKIFTRRTFRYVMGTCICISVVLITLGIMELAFFGDMGRGRSSDFWYFPSLSSSKVDDGEAVFENDTVWGRAFSFGDDLVIPQKVKVLKNGNYHRGYVMNFVVVDSSNSMKGVFDSSKEIESNGYEILRSEGGREILLAQSKDSVFCYLGKEVPIISCKLSENYDLVLPPMKEDRFASDDVPSRFISEDRVLISTFSGAYIYYILDIPKQEIIKIEKQDI